jgi:hypothetical protein
MLPGRPYAGTCKSADKERLALRMPGRKVFGLQHDRRPGSRNLGAIGSSIGRIVRAILNFLPYSEGSRDRFKCHQIRPHRHAGLCVSNR